MPTTIRWRVILSTTALALSAIGTAPALAQGEAESLSQSFRKAAQRALPAVVSVKAIGVVDPSERPAPYDPLWRRGRSGQDPLPQDEGGGSGVVIDAEKGFVLTNDHVVQNASKVVVLLQDGRERPASQIHRDPKSDLALLIIDPKGLTKADWGDSQSLDIGDWVLAVGQPFGLSGTVTAGIVSGKSRGIGMSMYEDLIQTDAAINPGSSGGPLVNLRGEIVGINTAIKTVRGVYEGVGFAIPAARARRVAADLAEHGRVRRSYLGIQIGTVDRSTLERLDQPGAVAITGVSPGSPAAEAGLRVDDVLLRLDGKPVGGSGQLQTAIETAPAGTPITVEVDRNGERHELKVVPKDQPESFGLRERPSNEIPKVRPGPFDGVPRFPGPIRPQAPPLYVPSAPPLYAPPPVVPYAPMSPPSYAIPPVAPYAPPSYAPPAPPPSAPPAYVPRIETDLRATDVHFPELGLRLSDPSPALVQRFRIAQPTHGLLIVGIDRDGPADRGGLETGMVITKLLDRTLDSIDDFRDALAKRPKDRDLIVRVLRGSKAELRLIPESVPEKAPASGEPDGQAKTPSNPD